MTFLGWLSDPFKGLSDLQLGDEKVTLNDLGDGFLNGKPAVYGRPAALFFFIVFFLVAENNNVGNGILNHNKWY